MLSPRKIKAAMLQGHKSPSWCVSSISIRFPWQETSIATSAEGSLLLLYLKFLSYSLRHNHRRRLPIIQQVMQGLRPAFHIAAAMSLVAAVTLLFRGRQIYAAPAQRLLRAHSRSRGDDSSP